MFSIQRKANLIFPVTCILSSANAFNLDQSKILSFGKELTQYNIILTFHDPGKETFENIVGKRANAGNQHFLLFPKRFLPIPNEFDFFQSRLFCPLQMLSIWNSLKCCRLVRTKSEAHSIKCKFVNSTTQSLLLKTLAKKPFENIVGKGENAGNQHFLLFPQHFLPNQLHKSSFELHLKCHLPMLSNWTGLKICRLVKS